MNDITLADNPAQHRFELKTASGQLAAFAEYNEIKGALLFTHTEVDPQFEGQGLGSRIAKFALDAVRERGLRAIPQCPFIAAWIGKHPEYLDLVAEEHRRAFIKA